jgi:hypothetical protein
MPHAPAAPSHHHAVQFYGSDSSLFTTVAGFLSQGLVDGNPAVIIATPAHRVAILEHLRARFIDVDEAKRRGDLLVLDAHQTLSAFMVGDEPSPERFQTTVGKLVEDLFRSRSDRILVRAYGEMVDVLWKEGRSNAAIRLEMLWNALAMRHRFALLCGYAMGNFYKQTQLFEEVCLQHTHHMMPGETSPPRPATKPDIH